MIPEILIPVILAGLSHLALVMGHLVSKAVTTIWATLHRLKLPWYVLIIILLIQLSDRIINVLGKTLGEMLLRHLRFRQVTNPKGTPDPYSFATASALANGCTLHFNAGRWVLMLFWFSRGGGSSSVADCVAFSFAVMLLVVAAPILGFCAATMWIEHEVVLERMYDLKRLVEIARQSNAASEGESDHAEGSETM